MTALAVAARFGWYWRRLRVMGPAEIAHRFGEAAQTQWLRWRGTASPAWGAPPPGFAARAAFCVAGDPGLPEPDWTFDPADPSLEALRAGRLEALGAAWQWSPGDADAWRRAPDTGALWPLRFFADIDHRPGNRWGDARVTWEPARLQWLVDLALLARASEGERRQSAVVLLEDALLSWVERNPPLVGIHYVSAMECALRLIAACHAVDMARALLTRRERVFAALVDLVSSHAALIERRLSLHSSAGNHTVAEAAGLAYAGLLFPELPRAGRWSARGLALLERELARQVLDDGGGLEQATWYLRFVTDLAALVLALQRHLGMVPSSVVADRVGRAGRFLGLLAGAGLPGFGDADDGYALSRRVAPPREPPLPQRLTVFPAAGCTVLRGGDAPGTAVLLDHGPLGMPPSFGHGHADALAVALACGGRELLCDPGTFGYGGSPAWRRYFRSTAAHNTVCVDGLDQSRQETAFMWSEPFAAELVRTLDDGERLLALARHRGYAARGVIHWRGVSLRSDGRVLVWDLVAGEGTHRASLRWHSAVPVRGAERAWLLGDDRVLEVEGGQAVACRRGGEPADGGWRSPGYGRREAIDTISVEHDGPLPCEFVSRIFPPALPLAPGLVRQDLDTFRQWMTRASAA